jgi:hypothetical protein
MAEDREFSVHRAGVLRMMIYPIQFDPEPVKGIDRVLKMVVFADHSKLRVPDVIAAIDAGLASDAVLSELIPQSHSERVIRGYLSAVRARLDSELPVERG